MTESKRSRRRGARRRRLLRLWPAGAALTLAITLALVFAGDARDMLRRRRLRRASVILITLDTLRADHLSGYGAGLVSTPNLDALAAGGLLFERCLAQTPLTLPSHATILSGTYPFHHRVRDNRTTRVPAGLPLISESFRARGCPTAAFVGSMVLDSTFGLDRGFDLYADRFEPHNPLHFWGEVRKPADAVLAEARAWIGGHADRRFFAWIHLYDPHAPWDAPPAWRGRYPAHPYRAAVAFMDDELGKFFSFLKARGLWGRSLIVVVADHGEGLGEHGEETHGYFVYQSTLHVPFLVLPPFRPPRQRLARPVELVDVAPTILEAAGLPLPAGVQGRSLLGAILHGTERSSDRAYGESYYSRIHYGWSELRTLLAANWKYVLAPAEELFDLASDPGETRNLAGARPEECRRLRSELLRFYAAGAKNPLPAEIPRLDSSTRRKLASLGYITTPAAHSPQQSRVDPKQKVAVIESLRLVNDLADKGRWTEAGRLARKILESDPQIGQARIASANAYRAAGDFGQAVVELRAGLSHAENDEQMLALLGETLSLTGQFREALTAFAGCVAIDPRNPASHNNLGLAHWNLGQLDEAEAAFARALSLDPRFALALVNQGRLYLHARRNPQRARQTLLAAVESAPRLAAAHDALAESYALSGSFARAAEHWARCLELEPQNYDACFNLLMIYARKLPDRRRALDCYERIRRDFLPRLPQEDKRAVEALRRSLD